MHALARNVYCLVLLLALTANGHSVLAQVTVTAANPASAAPGTTNLQVAISGSGFKKGAKASFFLTGTTNPADISVIGTSFVGSNQVVATISVSSTAADASYDIVVMNTNGSSGKDTELFGVNSTANGNGNVSDIAVTSFLSDVGPTGVSYYVQSDGQGAYQNAAQSVSSILTANGFNHITWADWQLDMLGSTVRTVRLTLSSLNEVQPGQPGYTVPPNPPFMGTRSVPGRLIDQCTGIGLNMLTMAAGTSFTCPALIRFNATKLNTFYRLYMYGSWTYVNVPETTQVQVQCNSVGSDGNCNDWFIDPIPVTNADGTTSPGTAIARLAYITTSSETNLGDFYLTFHYRIVRP